MSGGLFTRISSYIGLRSGGGGGSGKGGQQARKVLDSSPREGWSPSASSGGKSSSSKASSGGGARGGGGNQRSRTAGEETTDADDTDSDDDDDDMGDDEWALLEVPEGMAASSGAAPGRRKGLPVPVSSVVLGVEARPTDAENEGGEDVLVPADDLSEDSEVEDDAKSGGGISDEELWADSDSEKVDITSFYPEEKERRRAEEDGGESPEDAAEKERLVMESHICNGFAGIGRPDRFVDMEGLGNGLFGAPRNGAIAVEEPKLMKSTGGLPLNICDFYPPPLVELKPPPAPSDAGNPLMFALPHEDLSWMK